MIDSPFGSKVRWSISVAAGVVYLLWAVGGCPSGSQAQPSLKTSKTSPTRLEIQDFLQADTPAVGECYFSLGTRVTLICEPDSRIHKWLRVNANNLARLTLQVDEIGGEAQDIGQDLVLLAPLKPAFEGAGEGFFAVGKLTIVFRPHTEGDEWVRAQQDRIIRLAISQVSGT
ncbi:MAG: hypothetical protein HYW51_03375 [Candidatus Doudnabacteria bacterium]|nr:hypothetical protein [Candidatus Doudnabacteria bacterium]